MPKLAFWTWLFWGIGTGKPGALKLLTPWLILDLSLAGGIVFLAHPIQIVEIAKSITIPAAGILLGMTFAWSGNITALLSTDELSELAEVSQGKMSDYVYTVQFSILILFVSCILWIFAALGLCVNIILQLLLFFMSSMAIRQCWRTILFAQYMTICRDFISRQKKKKD